MILFLHGGGSPPLNALKIGIWEGRKVFGSRGQSLKEEKMGKHMETGNRNGKQFSKLKQSASVPLDKIVSGYQVVYGSEVNEVVVLSKCRNSISYLEKLDKEIAADVNSEDLRVQHTILRDCIEQLTAIETSRASLVSHLREALQEQEFKLEQVRNQLQPPFYCIRVDENGQSPYTLPLNPQRPLVSSFLHPESLQHNASSTSQQYTPTDPPPPPSSSPPPMPPRPLPPIVQLPPPQLTQNAGSLSSIGYRYSVTQSMAPLVMPGGAPVSGMDVSFYNSNKFIPEFSGFSL